MDIIALPSNEQAEAALLATCLAHPKQFVKVKDSIRPGDFYRESHAWAWEAMLQIDADSMPVSAITLADYLKRAGRLETFSSYHSQATGAAAIANLVSSDRANVRDIDGVVAILKNLSGKRAIYYLLQRQIEPTLNGKPAFEIMRNIQAELGAIELLPSMAKDGGLLTASQAAEKAAEAARNAGKNSASIKSGVVDLDNLLGGFRKGEYITIAARPGMGKSSLAATITAHAALRHNKRVGYFTLETGVDQLFNRMIAQESGINGEAIRDGTMTADQWQLYYQWLDKFSSLQITTCENPSLDMDAIRTFSRKIAYQGLDLLVIDYLGLISAPKESKRQRETRVQEISEMTRSIKILSRELNVPIICCAQMNRASEIRAEKAPVLSDLRESGSIEQDSDVVMFVWRKTDEASDVLLRVAKNRNGRVGEVSAFFNRTTTRFCNAARPG